MGRDVCPGNLPSRHSLGHLPGDTSPSWCAQTAQEEGSIAVQLMLAAVSGSGTGAAPTGTGTGLVSGGGGEARGAMEVVSSFHPPDQAQQQQPVMTVAAQLHAAQQAQHAAQRGPQRSRSGTALAASMHRQPCGPGAPPLADGLQQAAQQQVFAQQQTYVQQQQQQATSAQQQQQQDSDDVSTTPLHLLHRTCWHLVIAKTVLLKSIYIIAGF